MSAADASTVVSSSRHEMCPQCRRPAADDMYAPHRVTDQEALDWSVPPGLYHDGCCPECNGVSL